MGKSCGHYDVLGVRRNVQPEAVRKAYRRLVLRTHPDKGGNPDDFLRVLNAFARDASCAGGRLARVFLLRGCSKMPGGRTTRPPCLCFCVCLCVCVCVRACVCVCLSVLLVCLCFSVSDIVVLRQMFLVRFLQLLFPVVSFRFWFTLGSKVTPSSSVKRRF